MNAVAEQKDQQAFEGLYQQAFEGLYQELARKNQQRQHAAVPVAQAPSIIDVPVGEYKKTEGATNETLPALHGAEFYRVGMIRHQIGNRSPSIVIERCAKDGDQILVGWRRVAFRADLRGPARLVEGSVGGLPRALLYTQGAIDLLQATEADADAALRIKTC